MKTLKLILITSFITSLLFGINPAKATFENLSTGNVTTNPVFGVSPGIVTLSNGLKFTSTSSNYYSCNGGATEDSIYAFDGILGTKYCFNYGGPTGVLPNSIILHYLNGSVVINQLEIDTANDFPSRDPNSWVLYGSFDGINWNYIYSYSYGLTWNDQLPRYSSYPSVTFSNNISYPFIKFEVTDTLISNSNVIQYSELRLFGTKNLGVTTPEPPSLNSINYGNGSAIINFSQGSNGGSEIINYKYSLNGGSFLPFSPNVTSSPATILGLKNGSTYSVRLKALNSVGDSLVSNEITFLACSFVGNSGNANNSVGSSKSASIANSKSQGAGACQNSTTR